MRKLKIEQLAQIDKADIELGDFTIFIGPQASGKSIVLQLIKLLNDADAIAKEIKRQGFDWENNWEYFLNLYFGEGMDGIWKQNTKIYVENRLITQQQIENVLHKRGQPRKEKIFFIPAQRVLTLKNGWPRNFGDYESLDPFVVKEFSEEIRRLMEQGLGRGETPIFPQSGRLKKILREKINASIFSNARVVLDKSGFRKRIVLEVGGKRLPYMVWSAGQREFMPLLLGLYWLLPPSRKEKKEHDIVIIEESEMGLHPQAIVSLVLIFFELLNRGYKVILSTHSSVIVDIVWAIVNLQQARAKPYHLAQVFEIEDKSYFEFFQKVLSSVFKVYYFRKKENGEVDVEDISTLDPFSINDFEAEWGGLTSVATRVSEILAEIEEERSKRDLL